MILKKISQEKKDEMMKQAEISAKDIIAEENKDLGKSETPEEKKMDEIKQEIEDYRNRQALLEEKRFSKMHLEAERDDIKEILAADWNSPEYAGPYIKNDNICMNVGGDWKPFGPRSKKHLKVDLERMNAQVEKLDKFIIKLTAMIKEFEDKHPEVPKEE